MRLLARLLLAAVSAALPVGLALVSCGTDAVGVDACRTIETARCNAAPACDPGFDVTRCSLFYRDECLVGIQNADGGADLTNDPPACVAAIKAAIACIDAGSSTECQALIPSGSFCQETDAAATACSAVLSCPEVMPACAFLATPVVIDAGEAGTTVDASDGGSDSGDAAGE